MQRKVLLFPTYEQALFYRKSHAQANSAGILNISVETPYTWLKDAWERFGDGTKLVSSLERAFIVKYLIQSAKRPGNCTGISSHRRCNFFCQSIFC